MLLDALYQTIQILLTVLRWIIIIQAVMSWLFAFNVVNRSNDFLRQFFYALDRLTEPLYRPIRRILPDFGGIDFSPFVVLLIVIILQQVIVPDLFAVLRGAPLV